MLSYAYAHVTGFPKGGGGGGPLANVGTLQISSVIAPPMYWDIYLFIYLFIYIIYTEVPVQRS